MYFLIVSEARGLKPKSVGRVGLLWGLPRGLHMAVVALSSQGCPSACVVCSLISSFCKDTTHTGLSPSPYAKKMDAFEPWCWRRLLKFPWTARRSNQSVLGRSTLNIHWKDWCWSWSSRILVIWCEQTTHCKSPWCLEKLRAEEGVRGWGGWTASPMQWRWTWANSGRWWGAGRPGVLQSLGSKIGLDWVTEQWQQHTILYYLNCHFKDPISKYGPNLRC